MMKEEESKELIVDNVNLTFLWPFVQPLIDPLFNPYGILPPWFRIGQNGNGESFLSGLDSLGIN